ncbi:cysteine--tRNA ligase [Candidatus Woesearchaeota archaeon]|nr:cysteine--tRNA ligase [Candidatus Woesearchaeota archaeon]
MALKLYNTLSRKKELFKPIKKTEVGLYTCGPTVYNFAHIGNLRGFLFYDFVKRVFLFNDFKVKHVMNITDVGHLTSDADEGEDKMLKGAKREKKTVWEVAAFYTEAFKNDMKKLNFLFPRYLPKATDHIKEQIAFVKVLEKKGFTYTAGGNVYFDASKLKDYGKLVRLDLEAEGQARVEKDLNKNNPHDFVLWFTKSKFQDQGMKWKSPWGEGYPGWHLECSAMSMKYLGEQFDVHCGGIDHIPVHHTNEIAQSEAFTGKKPWVKYWLHNEFLVLGKGEKMAKSGENFLTLSVLEEKGYNPLDFRYFCLGTHYRKPLMFSFEALDGARNGFKKLTDKVLEIKTERKVKVNKKYLVRFTKEVNDDLNTPQALATMWEVLKDEKLSAGEKYFTLLEFDQVLGLGLKDLKVDKIPKAVVKLAEERLSARLDKDWKKADDLREKIAKFGYVVGDSKDGYELKKE